MNQLNLKRSLKGLVGMCLVVMLYTGVISMSQFVKSLVLIISSCILVVAFQNCGQPGSVSAASELSKAQAPLVVDVVGEMQVQEYADEEKEEVKKYGGRRKHGDHDPYADKEDGKKCDRDKKQYDRELEEVLSDYSCDERASSKGSDGKKVKICHYPSGNASARHELCVSRNSLEAHLNHGHGSVDHQDHLGSCNDEE